ncbi:MAG: DUF3850 domain-containing protein [Lachnospiraceae bacterium]|nr:DUF3850 domain-containing protein [Lachnospiraceae bacterium]
MDEIKEYTQLTIDDYLTYKKQLTQELNNLANGFIRAGYYLKKIRDAGAYKNDGYESIYEFAEKEYGITRTVASRFMSINDKFSEDGYSLELKEQYKGMGSSRLTEMLTLDEADHEMVTNVTRIEDIRELKRFEKQEPEKEATPYSELYRNFFEGKEKEFNTVMQAENVKDIAEIVNPSGNKTWKYRMLFMAMKEYDKGISIKDLLKPVPDTITWEQFVEQCRNIFKYDHEAAGTPYEQNYKQVDSEDVNTESGKEADREDRKKEEKQAGKGPEEKKKEEPEDTKKEPEEKTELENAENVDFTQCKAVSEIPENGSETTEIRSDEPEVVTGEVENIPNKDKNEVCDTAQNVENIECEGDSGNKVWCNDKGISYLKVSECYYEDITSRKKRFSIRYNDRDYKEGDEYILVFTNGIGILSYPHIHIRITYVLNSFKGLADGYIAFGYEVIDNEE